MSDNSNPDKNSDKSESNISSKEEVDSLQEQLEKASEKIETMEEKMIEQQKTTIALSKSKSEDMTLVLSLVVGLMGIMGVGHIYIGKVKRGVIILIIGIASWAAFFIPFAILGVMGDFEEDPSDPTVIIGMLGGFAIVGIGVLILFIWQVINSRKLCREYNEYLVENERPPW